MSDHTGHRERMKQRFLRYGLENFDDHNILELLLFYALPRKDTNEIAHALMETFGSLPAVFEAAPRELMKVDGIGENAAALLHLIPETARRYMIAKNDPGKVLASSDAVGQYLVSRYMNCREERVYFLCLDGKMKLLDCREIGVGDNQKVTVDVRRMVQMALSANAVAAIMAHNHPCGPALPSNEDLHMTSMVRDALEMIGVKLLDHIIVAGDDFVSLSDSGMIRRRF